MADCGPKLLIDDLDWWRDFEESAPLNSSFSVDPHRPAAIAYTSGTTGTPKGVAHSQHNLLWPGLATIEMDPPGIDDRTGSPLALSTLNIMVLGPLTAFLRGGTAVVMHRTDAPGLAADLAHHRVSRAVLVPTLLHDLVHGHVDPELLCTLCTVLVGGAGTPKTIRDQFASRFGVTPTLSYGFSEAPTGVARTGTDSDRGAAP
ncbi:MAG: long-chain fatty acid--CoA ligase, partial [Actinomycetia bacterium]|nr:long-chain fatty acid--CoA ligase [Actinomycetes bacterium]